MNSNLDTIFRSVTDTLTGGVTTDLMTVIMALVGLTIIMVAFFWIRDVLLENADENFDGLKGSRAGNVSRVHKKDEGDEVTKENAIL